MKNCVCKIVLGLAAVTLVSTFADSAFAAHRHHHHHHGVVVVAPVAPRVYVVPSYGFGGPAYGAYVVPHHHHHHHHRGW